MVKKIEKNLEKNKTRSNQQRSNVEVEVKKKEVTGDLNQMNKPTNCNRAFFQCNNLQETCTDQNMECFLFK